MKRKLEVLSTGGDLVTLDMSDSACSKFGFKHGDRIREPSGDKGTVIGVAPPNIGSERTENMILWYVLDRMEGRVSYASYGKEIKKIKT